MTPDIVVNLTKEAILITVIASMPAILASLIIGLLVALFSATTQIQEQTLSFAPKMIGVYLALIAFGAPVAAMLIGFAKTCFIEVFKASV